ncbi:low temperature requirement protein A [Streptomyces sp. NRRL B-24085]|uniref:low temperature requirement protein A n=1 Tax=Streptomyces sp. NRRL B-24085 TaxID=1709476 RepID=UPI00131D8E47|nr:low temperature requirement protein A [Streptomyces sp. NRRL B-24085]
MHPQTSEPSLPAPAGARHASWLELFFDLVAVAGVAQLAHLLHGDPDARDVGLYVVLFAAFWTVWISFTLYGNVAAETTRTRTLLLGMACLTVMAAAVHGVQEGDRGRTFAVAYVVARLIAGRVWEHRHQRVRGWPAARFTAGVTPWVMSLWVQEPARPWLWAAGLAVDLLLAVTVPARRGDGHPGRRVEQRAASVDPASPADGKFSEGAGKETLARVDVEHLTERLGLFVLIVLGEGVYQLVDGVSEGPWDTARRLSAPAAFLTLVVMWSLCLRRGLGGIPLLRTPPALGAVLAFHCCTAAAVAALGAGLGGVVADLGDTRPDQSLIMAAGAGAYILIAAGAGMRNTSGRTTWLLAGVLPAAALCTTVALTADALPSARQAWVITASIAWLSAAARTIFPACDPG